MTLATAATAILYLRGFRRLRLGLPETALRSKPPAFIGGLVVLWILSASPLSTLDHRLLTFHMLQHLPSTAQWSGSCAGTHQFGSAER